MSGSGRMRGARRPEATKRSGSAFNVSGELLLGRVVKIGCLRWLCFGFLLCVGCLGVLGGAWVVGELLSFFEPLDQVDLSSTVSLSSPRLELSAPFT